MRLPRVRFSVRRMMAVIAGIALCLGAFNFLADYDGVLLIGLACMVGPWVALLAAFWVLAAVLHDPGDRPTGPDPLKPK